MADETLPAESILVTLAAAWQYATARGLQVEAARRELTEVLCGARRKRAATGGLPAQYRYRSRRTQVDVMASVAREGPLHVVVAVSVRDYR